MVYRLSARPRLPDVDDEVERAAILVLATNAARVRRATLLTGICFGLVASAVGYLVLRELQVFAFLGWYSPWLSAVVGGVPPFLGSIRVAGRVANSLVQRRAPTWIDEVTRLYRVKPSTLSEYVDLL